MKSKKVPLFPSTQEHEHYHMTLTLAVVEKPPCCQASPGVHVLAPDAANTSSIEDLLVKDTIFTPVVSDYKAQMAAKLILF